MIGREGSEVESGSTVAESITITDNRTGESLEIPIDNGGVDAQAIEQAIANRKAAKEAKNYQEADRIRQALSDQGVELIDKPGGLTDWKMI